MVHVNMFMSNERSACGRNDHYVNIVISNGSLLVEERFIYVNIFSVKECHYC